MLLAQVWRGPPGTAATLSPRAGQEGAFAPALSWDGSCWQASARVQPHSIQGVPLLPATGHVQGLHTRLLRVPGDHLVDVPFRSCREKGTPGGAGEMGQEQAGWGCPCKDHPSPQPGAGMQTRLLRAVGWSLVAVLGVTGFLLVLTPVKDAALPTRNKVGAQWDLGEPGNDHQPLPTSHPSISPAFLSTCKSSRNQPSFSGLNLIKVALGHQ